jgi:hypothetical protein
LFDGQQGTSVGSLRPPAGIIWEVSSYYYIDAKPR